MAVSNFSLPFGSLSANLVPWSPSVSPLHPAHQELIANNNNLLYSPADHQQESTSSSVLRANYYKNNPYAPPQQHQEIAPHFNNGNSRGKNTYFSPAAATSSAMHTNIEYINQSPSHYQHFHLEQQQSQQQRQHFGQNSHINAQQRQRQQQQPRQQQPPAHISPSNSHFHASSASHTPQLNSLRESNYSPTSQYFNSLNIPTQSYNSQQQEQSEQSRVSITNKPPSVYAIATTNPISEVKFHSVISTVQVNKIDNSDGQQLLNNAGKNVYNNNLLPERPTGYTRVEAGHGSRTQLHAILDYDFEDDEEDIADHQFYPNESKDDGSGAHTLNVAPIQGPILIKNGTVPVVPLFSYPLLNNGTMMQIPIWWTALSVALGLSVHGDLVKGVPCVKRFHQLFCPTAGNNYPIEKIEHFIDENKALMRRMYGDFEMNMPSEGGSRKHKRFIDEPDEVLPHGVHSNDDDALPPNEEKLGGTYFGQLRYKRQTNNVIRLDQQLPNKEQNSSTGRLDACESKIEIVTPYWASNSAGKVRAIVNTKHFEQAIHQEMCSNAQTSRCKNDCGCEQKYKWHRLLAYDPDNDCKGIFMDWFLFPSCCVCRCNPN